MKLTLFHGTLAAACLALTLTQAQAGLIKASPAPPSGFLEHPTGSDPGRTPFNSVWRNPNPAAWERIRDFDRIVILPVNTAYLNASPRMPARDVQNMAQYMQCEFQNAFAKSGAYQIVQRRGPRTLVLELALVELRPTNVPGNVINTGAGVVVPGANFVGAQFTHGAIAFEGKLRNGQTGELLAEYADRQFDKLTAFSFRDYAEYAHDHKIVQDWALQMQRLSTTPLNIKVPGAMRFTFNPF